ncbi:MAG: hypothetical protein NC548_59970 [Lachnospiraceae bacterium]|nr:hypothetical protein [Lachnospiraceae bacterium]MCM1232153.1 hypothetical protein [Ruminococcus flavefaciens]MCM1559175.1 hypothetical protein [Butyrivibrio sp.]
MKITVYEVLRFIESIGGKFDLEGEDDVEFEGYCPLNTLKDNSITWVRNIDDIVLPEMNLYKNIVLIAEQGKKVEASFPVIYVENAHRTYFKIIEHFFDKEDMEKRRPEIESTAVIETNDVGEGVYIGHHTYIDKDVTIGNHVRIYHNVTIQGKCSIGDYTVIESGACIGVCGFGHYTDFDGNPVCVPHLGGVLIGKHVRIGANAAIVRGCLADTVIEDYAKIDNLCHIAHNVRIKSRAMLTASTVIAGSVTVGEGVWCGPGSMVKNGIEVEENAFLGIGAVATKSVPANKVMVGVPARVLRDRG